MIKVTISNNDYSPMKRVGNQYIVMWDKTPCYAYHPKTIEELTEGCKPTVTDMCTCMQHIYNHKPSFAEVQDLILGYYNALTQKRIVETFVWQGHNVWLSTENQMNYKAAYDLAMQTEGKTLPYTIKVDSEVYASFMHFTTLSSFGAFYKAMVAHIQGSLEEGWKMKNSIDWKQYEYL